MMSCAYQCATYFALCFCEDGFPVISLFAFGAVYVMPSVLVLPGEL